MSRNKRIRVGGLAVVAAVGLMALAGAGTASASTVLCTSHTTWCSGTDVLPSGSYIDGVVNTEPGYSGTSFVLEDSLLGKIVCSYAHIGGQTTAVSGNPLPAHGESYTPPAACVKYTYSFHNPQPSAEACTEFSISNPPATITAKGSGDGTMTVGTSAQHFSLSFTCRVSQENTTYKCTYGSESVAYQITSSEVAINEAPLTREAGGCIGSAKLTVHAQNFGSVSVSSI